MFQINSKYSIHKYQANKNVLKTREANIYLHYMSRVPAKIKQTCGDRFYKGVFVAKHSKTWILAYFAHYDVNSMSSPFVNTIII